MANGCSFPLFCAVLVMVAMSQGQEYRGSRVICRGRYVTKNLPRGQKGVSLMCAGRVSVSRNARLFLSGRPHLPVRPIRPRVSAKSCLEIKNKGLARGSHYYTLTNAQGKRYRAYCDMTVEGGGWTLFATKVTPTFKYLTNTPNLRVSPRANSAGCIPTGQWRQVMFRFLTDHGASRVVFDRYNGDGGPGKTTFIHALQCSLPFINQHNRIGGFYRHTPWVRNGARDPPTGFHTIGHFATYPRRSQLSEHHGDSDHWLNMWSTNLGGSKYYKVDKPDARGRKCVAGVCYSAAPILIMYR